MYSKKVIDHFEHPRNVGELPDASGVGEVGSPACGDIMKMWIKVDGNGIITDATFKTFGCASAVASSSMATEMIKGKHIDEARKITNKAIADALDGLPAHKLHCSVLASDALNRAIDDYLGVVPEEEDEVVCECTGISRKAIERAIRHGASTLDGIQEATGAMTGECEGIRCRDKISEILAQYT